MNIAVKRKKSFFMDEGMILMKKLTWQGLFS